MADTWPALVLRSAEPLDLEQEDELSALLDDCSPRAIQDLTPIPVPSGGLWEADPQPVPSQPATPPPLHWRVFFTNAVDRAASTAAIADRFPELILEIEDIPDEDWAARSQQALTAVRAGRFIVAPPWDVPKPSDATVVIVEPSRGFGTGHHPSTRLCLEAMSELDFRGARVIDLGTGSGVLAMAAFLSGARTVIAVDNDQDAIDSARQSAVLNPRVGTIHWLTLDFREPQWEALTGGPADVLLANLTGGMLIASAARLRQLLKPGGTLICSGFDEQEHPAVEAALALTRERIFTEAGWVGLTLLSSSEIVPHRP